MTNVELVNLGIGNTEANPYYPILTETEVTAILTSVDGDVSKAIKQAARNALFIVISIPNREKMGDIELWNNYSSLYIQALNAIIKDTDYTLPKGLMPYAGGIENTDYYSVKADPNRHASTISNIVQETKIYRRS